jgi:hypothetical protein
VLFFDARCDVVRTMVEQHCWPMKRSLGWDGALRRRSRRVLDDFGNPAARSTPPGNGRQMGLDRRGRRTNPELCRMKNLELLYSGQAKTVDTDLKELKLRVFDAAVAAAGVETSASRLGLLSWRPPGLSSAWWFQNFERPWLALAVILGSACAAQAAFSFGISSRLFLGQTRLLSQRYPETKAGNRLIALRQLRPEGDLSALLRNPSLVALAVIVTLTLPMVYLLALASPFLALLTTSVVCVAALRTQIRAYLEWDPEARKMYRHDRLLGLQWSQSLHQSPCCFVTVIHFEPPQVRVSRGLNPCLVLENGTVLDLGIRVMLDETDSLACTRLVGQPLSDAFDLPLCLPSAGLFESEKELKDCDKLEAGISARDWPAYHDPSKFHQLLSTLPPT